MSCLQDLRSHATRENQPVQSLAIFTICSNNFVPMARIFIESARRFHPEATFYLCLADELLHDPGFYPEGCTTVPIAQLQIPDFTSFAFRYDVMELNTAAKPFMFRYLMRAGHDITLYFDPDILVLSRLEQILAPLQGDASLVLTPHLCAPSEGKAYPDDIGIMRAGIYNLGFLGVRKSPQTESVISWWARRLLYQCINDQDAGIFVDQKFMDLVPGFLDGVCVLRDPTVNVAYWNLAQRDVTRDKDGWCVDGRPLGFFHFSGFDHRKPNQLSKHTEAFHGEAIPPAVRALMQVYAERLMANNHGSVPAGIYAYGRFASGNPVPSLVRKMFRERHVSWSANPFETYEEYLRAPMPGQWAGSDTMIVTNLMGFLRDEFDRVLANFDLTTHHGVFSQVDWFIRYGETSIGDARQIEPVAERRGRALSTTTRLPPSKRSADEPDINVIGYLRLALGVGEAGRLSLRSLNHVGVVARGVAISFNSASKSNDTSCEGLLDPQPLARFHLYNVNADQLLPVIEHLGPTVRPDAYRIIVPFWELSNLPDEWLPAFEVVDEVWAPTRFIQMTLAKKLQIPVLRMPTMLTFAAPPPVRRDKFNLPDDAFLFVFAFDYLSYPARKNPLGIIDAFRRAFRRNRGDARVRLVIKTMNAEIVPDSGRHMRDTLRDDPDLILIEQTLSRDETLALIGACDAVVSLHRSEGLGLLVAEAMILGKPVISTDYSGTTELVSPRTGWPVDYRLIPVKKGDYPFHEGQVWADPDIDHAAWQMRRVVEDQAEAARRVQAARLHVTGDYGADAVGRRQAARLRRIERR